MIPHVVYERIASGNRGVLTTVDRLVALATEYSPRVRGLARVIVYDAGVRADDTIQRAKAIYQWVQRHMLYTPDTVAPIVIDGVRDVVDEEIHSPEWLLNQIDDQGMAEGDCDDYVILMLALLVHVGIMPDIVLVSSSASKEWDHIYLLVHGGAPGVPPVPLDGITGQPFGWSVPEERVTARRIIPVKSLMVHGVPNGTRRATRGAGAMNDQLAVTVAGTQSIYGGLAGVGEEPYPDDTAGYEATWFPQREAERTSVMQDISALLRAGTPLAQAVIQANRALNPVVVRPASTVGGFSLTPGMIAVGVGAVALFMLTSKKRR